MCPRCKPDPIRAPQKSVQPKVFPILVLGFGDLAQIQPEEGHRFPLDIPVLQSKTPVQGWKIRQAQATQR